MVLINGLTIDEINAALIALQRSQGEVVGGVKNTTVQNISINNGAGGSGGNYDAQIIQLQQDYNKLVEKTDRIETLANTTSEQEQALEGQVASLAEQLRGLSIQSLYWDNEQRILTLATESEEYDVEIPDETVTLTLGNDNVLEFTMGVGETDNPQILHVTLPFIRSSEKGAVNGVASLDSTGRVPYSQLPESAMEFKGEWDAGTNTPHLADGTGVNGDFYVCSAGGTVNFGTQAEPRNITFYPNDRVIYEGDTEEWFRLPAGEVRTVNGMSGDVVLDASDIDYDNNTTVKQKIDSMGHVQSDWTETDSADPSFIKNKVPIWITTGSADDNMSPIDSVTDGNMRPVTSNAVYDALQNVATNIPVYPTEADAQADLANLEVDQFVATEDGQLFSTTDTVASGNMNAVTSNAVAGALASYKKVIKQDGIHFTNITQVFQQSTVDLGQEYPNGYSVSLSRYSPDSPTNHAYWASVECVYTTRQNNRYLDICVWGNEGTCDSLYIKYCVIAK